MSKVEKPGDDVSPDNHRVEIKSIDEALGFLFRGLLDANRKFVEGEDAGREGAIAALNAVCEFLHSIPGTHDHLQPIVALLNALTSLEEGTVVPMLKQKAAGRHGRRPSSAAHNCDKAMAVVTADRLCETGLDPEEAHKMVAKACREAGIKPSRKGAKDSQGQESEITDRTVRGWREKIAQGVGCHSQAAQTYKRLKQSWAAKTQIITHQAIETVGVEAVRRALLKELRRSLVEMRAAEH
jgi:hypothetical protein